MIGITLLLSIIPLDIDMGTFSKRIFIFGGTVTTNFISKSTLQMSKTPALHLSTYGTLDGINIFIEYQKPCN